MTQFSMAIRGNNARPSGARAFTLVELLVCMFLVTLVTFGIAQVFKLSRETVAVAAVIADFNRDRQSARNTMLHDADNWVNNLGVFYVASGYENIPDGNGGVQRVRRDRIAFPIHGNAFRRVTGGGGSFIKGETSDTAWVWYGHCIRSYTGSPVNTNPVIYATPTNVIGRVCMLMQDPNTALSPPLIDLDSNFFARTGNNNDDLSPFSNTTVDSGVVAGESYQYPKGSRYPLASGRYDIVGTTLSQFDQDVQTKLDHLGRNDPNSPKADNQWLTPNLGDWWRPLVEDTAGRPMRFFCCEKFADPSDPMGGAIHTERMTSSDQQDYYINGSTAAYAYTTPVLIRNASELIVHFSADIVAQDPATGDILLEKNPDGTDFVDAKGKRHLKPGDGQPDYEPVQDGNRNIIRQDVQWFGLDDPRFRAMKVYDWLDKRLVAQGIANGAKGVALDRIYFERSANGPINNSFVWLWVRGGVVAPKAVRVIFKQDDPEGLVRDGPWTEFVIGPR